MYVSKSGSKDTVDHHAVRKKPAYVKPLFEPKDYNKKAMASKMASNVRRVQTARSLGQVDSSKIDFKKAKEIYATMSLTGRNYRNQGGFVSARAQQFGNPPGSGLAPKTNPRVQYQPPTSVDMFNTCSSINSSAMPSPANERKFVWNTAATTTPSATRSGDKMVIKPASHFRELRGYEHVANPPPYEHGFMLSKEVRQYQGIFESCISSVFIFLAKHFLKKNTLLYFFFAGFEALRDRQN